MYKFKFVREDQVSGELNTLEFLCSPLTESSYIQYKFDQFMAGSGYEIGEEKPLAPGAKVFKHMADDLIKNSPSANSMITPIDEIKININDFNFDNMYNMTSAVQDDIIISLGDVKKEPFTFTDPNNCPMCNLPKNIMAANKCWDEKCPISFDSEITEHSLR